VSATSPLEYSQANSPMLVTSSGRQYAWAGIR
jgi:hypothetical protein